MSNVGPEASCGFRGPSGRLEALVRRAVAERIPLNGSIAMTHRCQLRCLHCYLGHERHAPPDDELPTEFWLSLIDDIAAAGCLNLLMTGGEPLVRKDFATVYRHAVERGLLVDVFTNATLIDAEVVALFSERRPRVVEVSLYGASAEVYDRVSGIPGSFERCLRGIDSLREARIPLAAKAMLLAANRHEMAGMRSLARALGVRFRLDPVVVPTLAGDGEPLGQRVPAAEAAAIEMQDAELRTRTADYLARRRGTVSGERLFMCLAGTTGFHVDAHGTLLPCLMVTRGGFDLRRGSFREGWLGPLASFQQQSPAHGYDCHRCELRFVCGVCPAQFELETGSPYHKSDYNCVLGAARAALAGAEGPGAQGE